MRCWSEYHQKRRDDGVVSERVYIKGRTQVEYAKVYQKENRERINRLSLQYYYDHPELKPQRKKQRKAYYYRNREKCIARAKEWALKNKDRVAASAKKYNDTNKEKRLEYGRKYRAKKRKRK